MNLDEQRSEPRVDIEVSIDLRSDHNFYTGLTQNVGNGGLFVATNQLRPVGTRLVVRFSLPGVPGPIEVPTEVRWLRERSATQPFAGAHGMGLKFLQISSEATKAVSEFVRKRESLFYDED